MKLYTRTQAFVKIRKKHSVTNYVSNVHVSLSFFFHTVVFSYAIKQTLGMTLLLVVYKTLG